MFDQQIALLGYRQGRLLLQIHGHFISPEGTKFVSQQRVIKMGKKKGENTKEYKQRKILSQNPKLINTLKNQIMKDFLMPLVMASTL